MWISGKFCKQRRAQIQELKICVSAAEWARRFIIGYEIREIIGTQISYVLMGYSEEFGYEWNENQWKPLESFEHQNDQICIVVLLFVCFVLFLEKAGIIK